MHVLKVVYMHVYKNIYVYIYIYTHERAHMLPYVFQISLNFTCLLLIDMQLFDIHTNFLVICMHSSDIHAHF
jgi:hypothetical protein